MRIMWDHEYFHTSVWSRLATGKLSQKMIKWPTCLGSQRLCIGLEGFKDFLSLETCAYFLRAVKTQGPSLPLPREDVFTLESKGFSLQRGDGAAIQATLCKLRVSS